MRDLNIIEHRHEVAWNRADFACAIIMHRARAAGDRDAAELYGEVPTDEQLTRYGVTDEQIDQLAQLSKVWLNDRAISAGWDWIESWVDDLEVRDGTDS